MICCCNLYTSYFPTSLVFMPSLCPRHHPVWRQQQREIHLLKPLPLSASFPRTPNDMRILPCSFHSTKPCTPDVVRLLAGSASQWRRVQSALAGRRSAGITMPRIGTVSLYLCHIKNSKDYDRKENHHPRRLQCRTVQKRSPVLFRG